MVSPLVKITSDHLPCVVKISTSIPKAKIFRFENHWVNQPGFLPLVKEVWDRPVRSSSAVGRISAKLKNVRYELKRWGRSLSHIKILIEKCNWVILFLDQLEDRRQLSVIEFNFRNIVKTHLKKLLRQQYDYWRQRCTVRWVKLGGETQNSSMPKPLRDTGVMPSLLLWMKMVIPWMTTKVKLLLFGIASKI